MAKMQDSVQMYALNLKKTAKTTQHLIEDKLTGLTPHGPAPRAALCSPALNVGAGGPSGFEAKVLTPGDCFGTWTPQKDHQKTFSDPPLRNLKHFVGKDASWSWWWFPVPMPCCQAQTPCISWGPGKLVSIQCMLFKTLKVVLTAAAYVNFYNLKPGVNMNHHWYCTNIATSIHNDNRYSKCTVYQKQAAINPSNKSP